MPDAPALLAAIEERSLRRIRKIRCGGVTKSAAKRAKQMVTDFTYRTLAAADLNGKRRPSKKAVMGLCHFGGKW